MSDIHVLLFFMYKSIGVYVGQVNVEESDSIHNRGTMLCGSRRGMFDPHSLGMVVDLWGMLLEFVLYHSLQIRVSGFMLDRSIQNLPYYLNFAVVVCVWRVVFDLQTSREDKKISVVWTIWIVHPFDL